MNDDRLMSEDVLRDVVRRTHLDLRKAEMDIDTLELHVKDIEARIKDYVEIGRVATIETRLDMYTKIAALIVSVLCSIVVAVTIKLLT